MWPHGWGHPQGWPQGQQQWHQGQQQWQQGQQQWPQPQQMPQQMAVMLVPTVPTMPPMPLAPTPLEYLGGAKGQAKGQEISPSPQHGQGPQEGRGKGETKGEGKGKVGKAQGKGLSPSPGKGQSKGQTKDKSKGKGGKAQGKGLSPSHEKGQDQSDSTGNGGKERKTPEQVKLDGRKRREQATVTDRSNTYWKGAYRVPYFHRRQRVPPGKMRKITTNLITQWKEKRTREGKQYLDKYWDGLQWSNYDPKSVAAFQRELPKMRKHMEDVFEHCFSEPRIIKDITGEGMLEFLDAELWPHGPSLNELPGIARPDNPKDTPDMQGKKKVWDAWFTDYAPEFWEHLFADCPWTTGEGKDICSSPDDPRSAESVADLIPKCSWLNFHGTSLTSGLVAVCQNAINRGEGGRGRPAKNDPYEAPAKKKDEEKKMAYEITCGRGVYTTADFQKARDYALPYANLEASKISAQIVLLVRIPGSLEKIGVQFKVQDASKRSYLQQQDLEGKEAWLPWNWAAFDLETTLPKWLEENQLIPADFAIRRGFTRWLRKSGKEFKLKNWEHDARHYQLRHEPEMQKRYDRCAMQTGAETSHYGEARWSNVDSQMYEVTSSAVSVVAMLVGYGPFQGKKNSDICQSRAGQAETSLDVNCLPPLCRPDNVEEKNKWLAVWREKPKEEREKPGTRVDPASSSGAAASSSGAAASSSEPQGLKLERPPTPPSPPPGDPPVDDFVPEW